MIPLTNNSTTPMKRQKSVTFAKKGSNIKCINDEHYRKVKDHCHYTGQYRGAAYAIQEIVQLKKSCGFHNGLNYDYHFVIIPTNMSWSLRRLKEDLIHVLKTSSTRLQCNNLLPYNTSIEDDLQRRHDVCQRHLARRPQDILEEKKLLCWRRLENMS